VLFPLLLGACSEQNQPVTAPERNDPKPSFAAAAAAPPSAGPIVIRSHDTNFNINWDLERNLVAFNFDIDNPPPFLDWANCTSGNLGNITDIQIVKPGSGQWVGSLRTAHGDAAVYDITGMADPFDVFTCAFLADPSRLLARGPSTVTGMDNDVIGTGPGNNVYHFQSHGQLLTPAGNPVQFQQDLIVHVWNDGTFTLTRNVVRLVPDPRQ
jgi:hypothetical protein